MYSNEIERLREEMLNVSYQIALIEKNRRLEGKEKEDAMIRLEELKKIQEDIRFKMKHQMVIERETQKRSGRT